MLCASLLALAALTASNARAQPQFDELRLIAPAAPGGGWDQTARSIQQALTDKQVAPEEHLVDAGYVDATLWVQSPRDFHMAL